MKVRAVSKNNRLSAQKARPLADEIRGLSVERAVEFLQFSVNKSSKLLLKTLDSAVANAEQNQNADVDELTVSGVWIDEGPTIKRIRARSRGRADRISKRTCHITVVVADDADYYDEFEEE